MGKYTELAEQFKASNDLLLKLTNQAYGAWTIPDAPELLSNVIFNASMCNYFCTCNAGKETDINKTRLHKHASALRVALDAIKNADIEIEPTDKTSIRKCPFKNSAWYRDNNIADLLEQHSAPCDAALELTKDYAHLQSKSSSGSNPNPTNQSKTSSGGSPTNPANPSPTKNKLSFGHRLRSKPIFLGN